MPNVFLIAPHNRRSGRRALPASLPERTGFGHQDFAISTFYLVSPKLSGVWLHDYAVQHGIMLT
jgi:hypothetical protein